MAEAFDSRGAQPEPPPEPYRRKIFYLDPSRLIHVLEGRLEIRGFPPDAKIVAANGDFYRCAIALLIESDSFEPVPLGDEPPRLEPGIVSYESVDVPKEQFGFSRMRVKEGAERLEKNDGTLKFREFL